MKTSPHCERTKLRYHLPTLSDTRWLSRVDSISTLLSNYEAVHEALDEVRVQSTGQSSHDAASYLYSMSAFCFIVAAVIYQYILAFTRPLSVVLLFLLLKSLLLRLGKLVTS